MWMLSFKEGKEKSENGKSIYNNPCVCLFVCPAVCVTLPFWEDNPMDQVMSHYISIIIRVSVCPSVCVTLPFWQENPMVMSRLLLILWLCQVFLLTLWLCHVLY